MIVYQMALEAKEDLAMVLPIPVVKGAGEDGVTFFDLSKYPALFANMALLFPMPKSAGEPFGEVSRGVGAAKLKVQSVGAYDASFVPRVADFSRLDERFRLPVGVWDEVPGYAKRLRQWEIGKELNDYDAIFAELKGKEFDGWLALRTGWMGWSNWCGVWRF